MTVFGTKNELPLKNHSVHSFFLKILPLVAFAVPLALLYLLNPMDTYLNVSAQQSFELMWKGRTFQLFFIWLIALEFILGWETITSKINLQNKPRLAALCSCPVASSIVCAFGIFGFKRCHRRLVTAEWSCFCRFYAACHRIPCLFSYLSLDAFACRLAKRA